MGPLLTTVKQKAALASTVAYCGAGLMVLLSLAGVVDAYATSKTTGFAVPDSGLDSAA